MNLSTGVNNADRSTKFEGAEDVSIFSIPLWIEISQRTLLKFKDKMS
jgi:hypothetical protein